MRTLLLGAGFAALVLVAGPGLTKAEAVGLTGAANSLLAGDTSLVQEARGRGHAYGHRHQGNRGLHRGGYKGRGNPHRVR